MARSQIFQLVATALPRFFKAWNYRGGAKRRLGSARSEWALPALANHSAAKYSANTGHLW